MLRFSTLWANHPTNQGNQAPCRLPTGLASFENQCAIRMGVCLQKSGVLPGQISGAITCNQASGTQHTGEHMHFIRADELGRAIMSASIEGMGPMKKFTVKEQTSNFPSEINGATGIIYFKDYWYRSTDNVKAGPTGDHIDLWNGWRTSAKILLPWFLWLGGYDRSREIWFREVR